MSSNVLNVVIDERSRLNDVDELELMQLIHPRDFNTTRRVFKDYILSSEVFKLETPNN